MENEQRAATDLTTEGQDLLENFFRIEGADIRNNVRNFVKQVADAQTKIIRLSTGRQAYDKAPE